MPAPTPALGDDRLRLPPTRGLLSGASNHPRGVDVLVVAVALLLGWVQTDRVGLAGPLWRVVGEGWLAVNVLTAAALLLCRRHPVVTVVVAGLGVLPALLDDRGPLLVPLVVSVYALAVHRSSRAATAGASVLTIVVLTVAYATGSALGRVPFFATVGVVLALLVGAAVGDRRRYLAAVLERAARLAAEQDRRAQLEAAAERARITRELHDVVAHSLSVIVRLSDGAEAVADSDPQRARAAVRQVGRVGRESLRDMRRMLGVLSGDQATPDLAPQPGLGDLEPLVATYRSAGLPVVVERSGDAALDHATQLVVYRCVQEGLTNALRYARTPTTVLVRLHLGRHVEVEVADDGSEVDPQPSVGSGRGLAGLRERAALYGGSVEAGPREDLDGRGWRTRLRIDPAVAAAGRSA